MTTRKINKKHVFLQKTHNPAPPKQYLRMWLLRTIKDLTLDSLPETKN